MFRSTVRATKVAPAARAKAHGLTRTVGRAHGRRLGHLAQLARRRVLALGQAVDPVVEEQDRDVHVPPQHVQQMVAADREAVAVAGDHEDLSSGRASFRPVATAGRGRGWCESRRWSCSRENDFGGRTPR